MNKNTQHQLASSAHLYMLDLASEIGVPRQFKPINVLPLPPRAASHEKPVRPIARKPVLPRSRACPRLCYDSDMDLIELGTLHNRRPEGIERPMIPHFRQIVQQEPPSPPESLENGLIGCVMY